MFLISENIDDKKDIATKNLANDSPLTVIQ